MTIMRILSASRVLSSATKLGVRLSQRGWYGKGERCPITAVVQATIDPNWSPDSCEPGDDLCSVQEASQKLGVSSRDVSGFVAGWDGHGYDGGRMTIVGYLWARFLRWRLKGLVTVEP